MLRARAAVGFTAAELQRGWLFAVEVHLAALARSSDSSPTYNAVLNDFLGRPADDVIGLNGTNCLTGIGKQIRRPPRDVTADRRALVSSMLGDGIKLPFSIERDDDGKLLRISILMPPYFLDQKSASGD